MTIANRAVYRFAPECGLFDGLRRRGEGGAMACVSPSPLSALFQNVLANDRQWQDLHAVLQRKGLRTRIDDDAPLGIEIFAGLMEASFNFWGQASLDLECPGTPSGKSEKEIDLRAGGGAVEVGLRPRRRRRDERFDNETLPTRTGTG